MAPSAILRGMITCSIRSSMAQLPGIQMRFTNVGIAVGIVSILISSYQALPTYHWSLFREILASGNLLIAVSAVVICTISNIRNPSKKNRIGLYIGIVAIVLSILTPNYIK
jgi:hypothetical protein